MRKLNQFIFFLFFIFCAAPTFGQGSTSPTAPVAGANGGNGGPYADNPPQTFLLWEKGAPGAIGDTDVDKPSITIYRAGRGAGPAVIIAPGGAYSREVMDLEGRQVATWFNGLNITAFVLKYRVAPYHYPIELDDAQRAIRMVRTRAAEFGIDPNKIGMMGFSAGGHLAATAGTHFDAGNPAATDPVDRASSRPDFLILAYPVISFQASVLGTSDVLKAMARSGENLLGDHPDPKLLQDLSDELQVTPQTPPTFLYQGTSDALVPVENSVAFYLALRKAGVPAELHTFEKQTHCCGLNLGDPASGMWPTLLINWIRGRGLLPAAAAPGGGRSGGGRSGATGAAVTTPQSGAQVSPSVAPAQPSR